MFSKIYKLFKHIIVSRFTKGVAFLLMLSLFFGTIVFAHYFYKAKRHLQENDPCKLQNRSEMRFYFAPLTLKRGVAVRPEYLKQYLRDINYSEVDSDTPATFFESGNSLKIVSHFPHVSTLTLSFGKGKLQSIAVNNVSVEQVEIEPLPMRNAVHFVTDNSLKDHNTRRVVLKSGNIPELVVDAVTSAEDYRFFQHFGMNWLTSIYRAVRNEGGGSSITQQLIKNNVIKGAKGEFFQDFGFGKTYERKFFEPFFAMAAENMMSKDEILAAYLSMIPMGASNGIELHGIVAASQEYFGKSLYELTLAEAATLAGMICAPSASVRFIRNNNACSEQEIKDGQCKNLLDRRNRVLSLMLRNHPTKYTEQAIAKAQAETLNFIFVSEHRKQEQADADSSLFAQYAAQNLPSDVIKLRAGEGELKVVTTLNAILQDEAGRLAKTGVDNLQAKVTRVCEEQKRTNPKQFAEKQVDCKAVKPQISIVAVDAQSGAILAMIGGMARRSPGSVGKPFYVLRGLEKGVWENRPLTAATILDPDIDAAKLSERCTEEVNLGKRGSVREGLAHSWNLHACVASESAGKPADFVGRITNSKPEQQLMAAIGGTAGAEIRLVDLIQAYTIFPNNGKMSPLMAHQAIYQNDNQVSFAAPQTAINTGPPATFITTDMMRSVLEEGTASSLRSLANLPANVQMGGKTGSGMVADLWFVGFTPRVVFGIWVGMPDNLPALRREDGFTASKVAVPLAAKFIQSIGKYNPDLLLGEFTQPSDVVQLRINPAKGCQVKTGGIQEYFIVGREPSMCE